MTKAQEKSKALKKMMSVYENSRDGQAAVEKIYCEKYSHLGKWKECEPCESLEPHIDNICCVCSTENEE